MDGNGPEDGSGADDNDAIREDATGKNADRTSSPESDDMPASILPSHEPVLLREVIDWLQPERGGLFVDCTEGMGGHTAAILAASGLTRVIGLDKDAESLAIAISRLGERFARNRFELYHRDFKELGQLLDSLQISSVSGILADLGISSFQLGDAGRGFSFLDDAPLDMRLDRSRGETAADLIARLSEQELADAIFEFGEERAARKIARSIARERKAHRIETTGQLASIVVRAVNLRGRWRIHPATRTFQAIRIAVNREMEGLGAFISDAASRLAPRARLAVISFHSLEDRAIKRAFKLESGQCQCTRPRPVSRFEPGASAAPGSDADVVCEVCGARNRLRILTRKPVLPGPDEVRRNPRSRSAKLRVAERVFGRPGSLSHGGPEL